MHAAVRVLVVGVYFLSACACAAPVCQVSSSGVAFGTTDTLHAGKRSSVGLLKLRCVGPGEALVTIGLPVEGSNFRRRHFPFATQSPAFTLYLDPAHQRPWGDGIAGTFVIQRRVSDGFMEQIPVYADLMMDGRSAPGDYRDALAIQVQVSELVVD